MPVPNAIQNAPELFIGCEMFYEAFMSLNTCRGFTANGAENPIGWLTIKEYCTIQGIGDEQEEDLFYHISKMDSAYLKYRLEQIKNRPKNGGK